MMRRLILFCLTLFGLSMTALTYADSAFTKRHDVQAFIHDMVKQHGFRQSELIGVMNQVQLQPQIIESMEKPYEKKTWDVYKQLFLTHQRVQEGLDFWKANQQSLALAEKQFHVPANIIVAILGVETLYGKRQGTYRVLDALSTLAFNYPKRAPFFKKELKEYLLLCREQQVSPTQYLGSYAGAIGMPQFMPSSYRYYAASFNGQSKKDLVNDRAAVIASIANYIHKHGWKMAEGIAQPAKIEGNHYKRINTNNKKADYPWKTLTSAGVKPLTAAMHAPNIAGLIELINQSGSEFWIAYPNFYVITHYNSSPQYAMVVYLLSQQLKWQWVAMNKTNQYAYV